MRMIEWLLRWAMIMPFADGDGGGDGGGDDKGGDKSGDISDNRDVEDLNNRNKGDGDDDKGGDDKGDDKGDKGGNWYDSLEPEYRDDESIKKYGSLTEFAKGHKNLVSKLGKDKIVKPKEDWEEGDWTEFFNEIGRPEKADEYKLPDVEIPDNVKIIGDDKQYKELAHKHGLTAKQAGDLYKDFMEMQKTVALETIAENKQAMEDAETALRKEWGKAYDTKVKLATDAFKTHASEADAEAFVKKGYGNDPAIIKVLANMASKLSEDNLGDTKHVEGALTPAEAQKKINQVMGNLKSPYFDASHPEHDDIKEQMDAWHKMAHPEKETDTITE